MQRHDSQIQRLSPVQVLYLSRLSRLVEKKRIEWGLLKEDRKALLNKAIFGTFRELVEMGLGNDARTMLESEHIHNRPNPERR